LSSFVVLLDATPCYLVDNLILILSFFLLQGTCQNLEKSYFRLTSAPDPSTVRPEPVLRRALEKLVHLIATGEVNYFYAQDQFKGLRQDCVVQALQGPIALAVYEAHARAALEYGDVAEYNQCQGQMAALLSEGVKSEGNCEAEFLACRVLYQTVHARHGEQLQLLNTLRKVGPREASVEEVAHALKVRSAVASEDYALFFKLYSTAPKLGRALMDLAVPRLRFGCLNSCVKAFKPSLPVDFLARMLGFVNVNNPGEEEEEEGKKNKEKIEKQPLPGCASAVFIGAHAAKSLDIGRQECLDWLTECGAVITGQGGDAVIDCKASTGQLTMPPEKEKVAHGDANLDIGDFLKSFE
jgi:SAC3 family protein LENG8/THP3